MGGLLTYLVGPGKSDEHTEPHLVAGDPALMTWYGEAELSRADGLAIAEHLDLPRSVFGTQVSGGHVWHCSLSLRAEEGLQTDQMWQQIAEAFIQKMGFEDGVKAPVRWAAVRHGVSAGGNDHIHLAVNLIREDGTKASTHLDYARAQRTARDLEAQFGLEQLDPDRAGKAVYIRAEVEIAARNAAKNLFADQVAAGAATGRWEDLPAAQRQGLANAQLRTVEPARVRLRRIVRASATASADEAEFVRRLRRNGLLVRPRYASGRQDVVAGYSVADRAPAGDKPVFVGGWLLGKDLTLPRLRQDWPDTPAHAHAAVAEWNAGRRNTRPVAPGRETLEPDPQLWDAAAKDLAHLREQLRSVPVDDLDTWARVARETSGALAAWSVRAEPTPGPLAAAAAQLAQSAQTRTTKPAPAGGGVSLAGTAMLLAAAATTKDPGMAQALILRQMLNLMKAIADAHQATGDARRYQGIERAVREQLVQVARALPNPDQVAVAVPAGGPASETEAGTKAEEAVRIARQAQQEPLRAAPPIPNPLQPRPAASSTPTPSRGPEIER